MPSHLTIHDLSDESYEPTPRDMMAALSVLDTRFSNLDFKFSALDTKVTGIYRSILEREDNIDARLKVVEQRTGKMDSKIEDIQDDLTSALDAIDRDSVSIVNFGNRISILEMAIIV